MKQEPTPRGVGIPRLKAGEDVNCPWCGAGEVERVGEVGPSLMTSQWICAACGSPFERIRRRGAGGDDRKG